MKFSEYYQTLERMAEADYRAEQERKKRAQERKQERKNARREKLAARDYDVCISDTDLDSFLSGDNIPCEW